MIPELGFIKTRAKPLGFVFILTCIAGVLFLKEASFPALLTWLIFLACIIPFVRWSLKDPEVPLFLLTAMIPFGAQMGGTFESAAGIPPALLLALFVLFLWKKEGYSAGETEWRWSTAGLPLLLFLGWALLSFIKDFYLGFGYIFPHLAEFFRGWGVPILLFFIFYNALGREETLKSTAVIMTGVACIAALLAAYDYWASGERVAGIFAQPNRLIDPPNQLAAFFNYMMFLPLGLFLCYYHRPFGWLCLLPFLVFLRGLMVTFSRGGYMAFAAGLAVTALLRNWILFVLLAAAGTVMLMHPEFLPEGVRWRLGQTFETRVRYHDGEKQAVSQLDRSSSDRLEIWKAAQGMIKDNPVFGVGYGRFRSKVQNYWYAGIPFEPHNTYLGIAAQMGIPALLFLVWAHGVFFFEGILLYWKSKDPFAKALALGFTGGLVSLLISHAYISRLDFPFIISYFWMYAALVLRMRKGLSNAV